MTAARVFVCNGEGMTINVREAYASDDSRLGEIREAATEILRRTYRPSAELDVLRTMKPDQWTVFVAVRSSVIIGTVECRRVEGMFHLRGLAVDPAHHRTGVARALTNFLLARAQELGAKRLSLYTIAETGNIAVFEHLGFHVVSSNPAGGFESDSHSELREVYMERTIS